MSGLTIGTPIIKAGARDFKRGFVSPLLFDYLNISLPCETTTCQMEHATADGCGFTAKDGNALEMEISIPTIDPNMTLVVVDPFDFIVQTENQTCRASYTGPTTAVLSPSGCPVALNVKITGAYELVYAATQECLPDKEEDRSHFRINSCKTRRPGDEKELIQVKSHHGFLYIYCWKSQITIENQLQPCPEEVFILPVGTRFQINEKDFVGSVVNIIHQESPDPAFTIKTNHHLNPRLNMSELMRDPMLTHIFNPHAEGHRFGTDDHGHLMIGLLVGLLIIIGILVVVIILCYYCNRKVKVEVIKTPKPRAPPGPDQLPAWVFSPDSVEPDQNIIPN
ncbi:hypothetical protein Fcan01_22684 [Folsomia candida]|uniref:Uncharacterized protein n=1 Tax=Folsomia candida TaxID=158441 RepID=A0A226DCX4_FOLCA|nr:hypothetical protein Fcan01_22684 [Folsomia candida]